MYEKHKNALLAAFCVEIMESMCYNSKILYNSITMTLSQPASGPYTDGALLEKGKTA